MLIQVYYKKSNLLGGIMDKFRYVEFLVGLAAMLVSISICWGVLQNKITNIETQQDRTRIDHDLLTTIATKIEVMQKDIAELKVDCKEINSRLK
jgi:hypothetical protein